MIHSLGNLIDVRGTPSGIVVQYTIPAGLGRCYVLGGSGVVNIVAAGGISFVLLNKTGNTILSIYPGPAADRGSGTPQVTLAIAPQQLAGGVSSSEVVIGVSAPIQVAEGDVLQMFTSEVAGTWNSFIWRLLTNA